MSNLPGNFYQRLNIVEKVLKLLNYTMNSGEFNNSEWIIECEEKFNKEKPSVQYSDIKVTFDWKSKLNDVCVSVREGSNNAIYYYIKSIAQSKNSFITKDDNVIACLICDENGVYEAVDIEDIKSITIKYTDQDTVKESSFVLKG